MYENTYMYAIERSPEYLAHYGIRGMRWGVRKARESGNTRALGRQYRKAQKKLAKLEKRAASGRKYARRAALLGAGAAAAGGLAAAGTGGVSNAMHQVGSFGSRAMRGVGAGMSGVGSAIAKAAPGIGNRKLRSLAIRAGHNINTAGKSVGNAAAPMGVGVARGAEAVSKWGHSKSISNGIADRINMAGGKHVANSFVNGNKLEGQLGARTITGADKIKKSGITNNTIARVGAGALGVGLAGAAGYNAYRAATTKRAARKAAEFRKEMNKAFKGTQYANGGGNRQGKKRQK